YQLTWVALTLTRRRPVFWDGGNGVLFKDVGAGTNLIGRRMFSLPPTLQYSAIVISWDAAKGTWGTHIEKMHGQVRIFAVVGIQDAAEVHPGQNVTIKDHDGVMAQVVIDIANTAAGA